VKKGMEYNDAVQKTLYVFKRIHGLISSSSFSEALHLFNEPFPICALYNKCAGCKLQNKWCTGENRTQFAAVMEHADRAMSLKYVYRWLNKFEYNM